MSLIARASHLGGQWTALMIGIGTFVVTLMGVIPHPLLPAAKPLAICLAAGIVNGLGMLAFGTLVAWEGMELSKLISIAWGLVLIVISVGAWFFFEEQFTASKITGIISIVVGIYLLS
ncbi:MAG: hypothetical protein A3F21_00455 [Candidatus Portnoybacteria bacterium RIFCSPLOWO2_01_FULL_38_39]|uniref:EamA domain-containing protein n=1 Tax=Candidatus Portnoybacteria bacterium RIFCSPHIGHO2_12_FULL_38_9 TaxID=1801997 RepID=A0A1G2FG51_9BACT|nr:MAG: hypothetical protein A3H00_03200 [Candidatus Portnoybacteria bacterium RBG_13_40_8]OGZ36797.1 MAG: hypothetical protein A3J64_02530 [Candidatus Portnoybacteria bacterium RIFCSPHIGHO2_12_FULL_38_9]OGZ38060.1 MAG: hypothetical protein A3F21_00455 [Candidatus Portnoybacteria bacterium RIFCSPLOWO2_01_FULL_38_39]